MSEHISVLLEESMEALNLHPDGIYVDATLGRAGHSTEILKQLSTGHLYAFDKDEQAIEECSLKLKDYEKKVTLIHADFSRMVEKLHELGVEKVDGILFDLGVSSPQFDQGERGFSYRFEARLDMRMDQKQDLDAYQVVNNYSAKELTDIFFKYSEERYAPKIASKICEVRAIQPIETTFELVDIIKSCLPAKELRKKKHPAKQVFQAIRMEVNDELGSLEQALNQACSLLEEGGRLAVISFHSIEDRMVKHILKKHCEVEQPDTRLPIKSRDIKQADFRLVHKKPILAKETELEINRRSHSAKLRVIERRIKEYGTSC
ncbi:16S rRNA (cytosine(1402)-N(4))-methyltransferase RsmH [Bulleidia sp. zg-1006]|uniref:16S rRNA (cytosine(1402)-N(4))-methyltransferase RsmH n=1 Tax=Bulleidia sp. zg-1006 TaxID=2806552 RepID=UPI00193AAA03|nr:16S rRNA (cytosine(1402)-N(4))-methyltransferase RsmH [Bulleidia sp. zg-1006]QRG86169.1 16S rRNA (cytosine(1402)-N(4))-methyltransferase RsmH [Bulleidia sp. zg-1006]